MSHLRLDIVDRETDVVESDFSQRRQLRIGYRIRMPVLQQLHFHPRRRVRQHQRMVLGFDPGHSHVARELLSGDHDRHGFLEPEQREEPLRPVDIGDYDRHVVEMLDHLNLLSTDAILPVGANVLRLTRSMHAGGVATAAAPSVIVTRAPISATSPPPPAWRSKTPRGGWISHSSSRAYATR